MDPKAAASAVFDAAGPSHCIHPGAKREAEQACTALDDALTSYGSCGAVTCQLSTGFGASRSKPLQVVMCIHQHGLADKK
jgi:hypothetical protein